MKTIKFIIILTLLSNISSAQLKVVSNGNVAIGINWPNHSLHVWGYSQAFNYNSKEILFRPFDQSGSRFHSTIGSNLGEIIFWHPDWGYNTLTRGIPELVDTTAQGLLSLNYEGIIPFLVGAIKEQASKIDSLKSLLPNQTSSRMINTTNNSNDSLRKELENLRQQIKYIQDNCCKSSSNSSSGTTLNSSPNTVLNINNDFITTTNDILLQNVPNPFDNTTTIKFNIPEQYQGKFYLKIYTVSGEEKMSYSLDKKDKQITISSSNLGSGIYLYALIVNNDVLSIKQMVISK
ncbi:MAG: T9SS type A sorting domain-containing protein [Bacteroidetes bacterium]|nr:T9SS type A sorting domain-containing protein [Bacteroidota bacterium]